MTEAHGTDINETIIVKGLDFSAQLTIGAAKWLVRTSGTPLVQFGEELLAMKGDTFDVPKVAMLLTALYIAANPGVDPKEAEAKVDALTFPDMMKLLERARPWEFEAKNSQPAPEPTPEPAPSTGPPSSTT